MSLIPFRIVPFAKHPLINPNWRNSRGKTTLLRSSLTSQAKLYQTQFKLLFHNLRRLELHKVLNERTRKRNQKPFLHHPRKTPK